MAKPKPTPNPFERILKASVKDNPKPKKKTGKKKSGSKTAKKS